MKRRLLKAAILLYCVLALFESSVATSIDQQREGAIQRAYGQIKEYKSSSRWFMDLPPFIYNMCAIYYVVPDCMAEMFGDEFDISSMLEEICPA